MGLASWLRFSRRGAVVREWRCWLLRLRLLTGFAPARHLLSGMSGHEFFCRENGVFGSFARSLAPNIDDYKVRGLPNVNLTTQHRGPVHSAYRGA